MDTRAGWLLDSETDAEMWAKQLAICHDLITEYEWNVWKRSVQEPLGRKWAVDVAQNSLPQFCQILECALPDSNPRFSLIASNEEPQNRREFLQSLSSPEIFSIGEFVDEFAFIREAGPFDLISLLRPKHQDWLDAYQVKSAYAFAIVARFEPEEPSSAVPQVEIAAHFVLWLARELSPEQSIAATSIFKRLAYCVQTMIDLASSRQPVQIRRKSD
ncbi:hypothetical protein NA78x_005471 [Anatilimnocola sp. NA78]|uniref:hypothetical protein n=1 Tax=Anatilimnocola sp. NA78 TaxID=3415683 RepID=UPI003CE4EEFE